jgi:hypothetical protein
MRRRTLQLALRTSNDATAARRRDQARRFDASNFERARALVETFTPRALYVYAMGIEPWLGALMSADSSAAARPMIESDRLIAFARERGIPAFRLAGQRRLSFRER